MVTGGGTIVAVSVTGGAVVIALIVVVTVVGTVTVLMVGLIIISVWVTGIVVVIVGGIIVIKVLVQDTETRHKTMAAVRQTKTSLMFLFIYSTCVHSYPLYHRTFPIPKLMYGRLIEKQSLVNGVSVGAG
jgi:hypothetical protein